MKADRKTLYLSIVLSAACSPEATLEESVDSEPPALVDITADHDQVRAAVNPAAEPPLAPLTWSVNISRTAQAWASKCRFAHNPNRGQLGENLAAFTDTSGSAAKAVAQWAAEVSSYDYVANACATGQVCGHYTQIVWRTTSQLGCWVQDCTTGSPFPGFPNWQFYVCNYSPPGNFVGQRPYLCGGEVC